MKEVLQNIDWIQLVSIIWTVVLLPILTYIGTQLKNAIKDKAFNTYADILYQNVTAAVKDVYETTVKEIKGSKDWTPEKQAEVKEIAKTKAIHALSTSAHQILKAANKDFDTWLDSLIGTALYDLKNQEGGTAEWKN